MGSPEAGLGALFGAPFGRVFGGIHALVRSNGPGAHGPLALGRPQIGLWEAYFRPYSGGLLSRSGAIYTLSYVQMAQGPSGPWAWGGPK